LTHRDNGAAAERRAAHYLQQAGLTLVVCNYRSPYGEIDLIMQQEDELVFVEVRFRTRTDYGSPLESVDHRKQARLRATAAHYLQQDRTASNRPCRFDIVAITASPEGEHTEWLRNAF
jgi:putative endonuclease